MKAANEVAKDHICRIIFLNLVVDEQKVVSYQMTKAFSKLEKAQSVLNGRSKPNNFEPYIISLLHILNKVWDSETYEKETAPIVASLEEYDSSNQITGKLYAY